MFEKGLPVVRWFGATSLMVAMVTMSSPASAACKMSEYLKIPVTMAGKQPIVTTQINGRDARFILDSGAFFSTIAKASAQEYGLSVGSLGSGAYLKGIGGQASLGVAKAKEFRIAGAALPNIEFAVGGSDMGYVGLLGQNILGLADVEYDLPHGFIRLMKGEGCKNSAMAYWAGTKPYTQVDILPMDAHQRHTIGWIKLNGVKVKAIFDTGAQGSLLSLAGAKRVGVTPESPGVTPDGFSYGLGHNRVRSWPARFDMIDFGGEAISKPWIEIMDQPLDDGDMLVGIDFFLTHHIYVDNQNHRMFITYEGGPVFGLEPKGARDSATGAALDLTDKAGEPTDAAGFSRRGAILASSHKFDQAIADFDKAVAMDPGQAHYLYQRALARLDNQQLLLGAADIDKAITLAPTDADARMLRARLRLRGRDPAGALVDLKAADAALAPSADGRIRLAGLYDGAESYEPALASYDLWLRAHPEDSGRATALNGRCWARALLNRELDKALDDCNGALRMRPGEANYLDSRALVRLRRGEFDKAQADYDAAIAIQPRNAWMLYNRSLVERRTGKTAQADADRKLALAINPKVEERAKRYGLQ